MFLSRYTLKNILSTEVAIPDDELFELPEKVLQFGTGVLLRGLPDYFIDKANRQGIFNGRVVVVKSTDTAILPHLINRMDCIRCAFVDWKMEENWKRISSIPLSAAC